MAEWARIPVHALGLGKSANAKLLDVLQRDNELLESIQVDFSALIRELELKSGVIEVTCFFEELPLPVFRKVVSNESATFDGHDPVSIHANHRNMVRFASAEENGFKRVLGELLRWQSKIGK